MGYADASIASHSFTLVVDERYDIYYSQYSENALCLHKTV
jgi:hypothetical protein